MTTERMASKTEVLEGILDELDRNLGGDVNGSAVVSLDGIVFAARFSGNVNVDRLSAIAATTLGVGRRVARDLTIGVCEETIIRCDNGYFLVVPAGERSLLAINLRKGGNLGMIRIEASEAARQIAGVI